VEPRCGARMKHSLHGRALEVPSCGASMSVFLRRRRAGSVSRGGSGGKEMKRGFSACEKAFVQGTHSDESPTSRLPHPCLVVPLCCVHLPACQ
jgi:hypothetical protein